MFLGHFAVACLLGALVPSMPFWILTAATQFADLIFGILVLLGLEKLRIVPHANPSNDMEVNYIAYTHSLASTALLGIAGFIFWNFLKRKVC